ncbi:hypothetical protein SMICM304S_09694 [Streptomyces microflavus]
MSESTVTRVWAYGAISAHLSSSKASGAQGANGAFSQGPQASVKAFTSSIRMCSALMCSHFL